MRRDPERRRRYSFSPGRKDSIRLPRDSKRPLVPPRISKIKDTAIVADTERPESSSVGKRVIRVSVQVPEDTEDWLRVPTLHKRSTRDLARRKSSKKWKDEHDREAEIKAMGFMPERAATIASRSTQRENRKVHERLNPNLQNLFSVISWPSGGSIQSSLSSKSEHQTSYRLSVFDVLSPRPTIRYSENPRHALEPSAFGGSDRSESRKRKISERVSIPEELLNANKRVDDLADDLDASELRELMERDQKRREQKKLAEMNKMEKKLARRQEKRREEEATAARNGTPPPPNMERGVLGREVVGLGIGTSAVVTSSKRKSSMASESGRESRPAEAFRGDSETSSPNLLGELHRSANLQSEKVAPGSKNSESVIEQARAGAVDEANVSPPPSLRGNSRGASNASQITELPKAAQVDALVPVPKVSEGETSSESSTRARAQSWTSFFKRSKTKRASTPSFSNTSRDSMQHSQGTQFTYAPVKTASSIPKRTMSKFREDLPDFPLSPPDSRVQSPEADIVPPIRTDYPDKKTGNRASSDDPHEYAMIRLRAVIDHSM